MLGSARQQFGFSEEEMKTLLEKVRQGYHEIGKLFGLKHFSGEEVFSILEQQFLSEDEQCG
ncbi:MAG: hypothetical protein ACE5I1_21010 [bacterium]